jgi:ATP phosphoribosyltransferase
MCPLPSNNGGGLKLALPKGSLMADIAGHMASRGFVVPGYDETSRVYRLRSEEPPGVFVKVFSEKDIPIQVAVGNYDVGVAGRDWIEELTAGYRFIDIVSVAEMGYRHETLFAAGAPGKTLDDIRRDRRSEFVRIVSEYPHLAERFARESRFPRYRVFPVWGAAHAYIPRCADIAVVRVPSENGDGDGEVQKLGLSPLARIMPSVATLIANRTSFETRDLSRILGRFTEGI